MRIKRTNWKKNMTSILKMYASGLSKLTVSNLNSI